VITDDAPVRAARGEQHRREQQLAHERGVALEERGALPAEDGVFKHEKDYWNFLAYGIVL
jgi:hypothetical protein